MNTNTNTTEDIRELVRNMTNSILKLHSPHHAIGTLEALLYMSINDMPTNLQQNYIDLIKSSTITI